MAGPRALITFLIASLALLGSVGSAGAEEAAPEAEETPPAETPEAAESAEGGEEAAPEAGGEAEATPTKLRTAITPEPVATRAPRVKLRATPGAVSAEEIEQRTAQLNKSVETAEVRLRELAERVLSGKMSPAGANLVFQNEMGSSFKLIKAVFALDGAPIFSRVDESGELESREEIELFNGSIVPGEHKLSVNLEYRGHGYGIFSYLKGYRFKVRSSYSFTVKERRLDRIRIVGFEKGDQNTPLEERPDIRYVERDEALPATGAITGSASDDD